MCSILVISNSMGPRKNFRDIRRFEVSRVKYLRPKWLAPPNHFSISMVFKISVLKIPKFNSFSLFQSIAFIRNCNKNKNSHIKQ
jgi:hypothetical protein